MQIIVVGTGVTGISCAHSLLKRGHKVTLIESASSPNQGCSFGMAGFMGALSIAMLCSPFKGKAGLASVFAKTRRLGWDMSLSHMKFLRSLANSRSADKWKKDSQSLIDLARYSVGLTEFEARLQDISFEQTYGLLRLYTNETVWEEAHKEEEARKGGEWLDAEETKRLENSIEVPDLLGSFYMPQELSGNGSYFSKQIQMLNIADPDLTMMYHTTVTKLIKGENGKITGVETDKGEISADVVVLSNNVGAKALLANVLDLPIAVVTGWTITAAIQPVNAVPTHSLQFENKDILITRLGNRLRVCGRFWLGDVSKDVADKTIEELYQAACKLVPQSAVWTDTTNWSGQTLIHPDSLPSCGKTSLEGLYLNICHGLNGWALSTGCGELLADVIEGKTPAVNPELYSPERFAKKN